MSHFVARADVATRRPPAAAPRGPDPFEDVVRRYNRAVRREAYRITRNVDDARDVAQFVFMQMYIKAPDFDGERSIERWLYIVTRNAALNVYRRRLREEAALTVTGDDLRQRGLEDTVLRNERARQIRDTIALLPAADRHVIELRHLQSIPPAEIAVSLGVPLKRVKRDMERARFRLRIEMMRRGLDDDV
jgi:RNA polymerase sigma-70 factor (ECF subfamily)